MKTLINKLNIILLLVLFSSSHDGDYLYFGPCFGLDYGGAGAKFEFLPVKYDGLFGGAGGRKCKKKKIESKKIFSPAGVETWRAASPGVPRLQASATNYFD